MRFDFIKNTLSYLKIKDIHYKGYHNIGHQISRHESLVRSRQHYEREIKELRKKRSEYAALERDSLATLKSYPQGLKYLEHRDEMLKRFF